MGNFVKGTRKCIGNFIHNGQRHYINQTVDLEKAEIDADSLAALTKAGCLLEVKPKAKPKAKAGTEGTGGTGDGGTGDA